MYVKSNGVSIDDQCTSNQINNTVGRDDRFITVIVIVYSPNEKINVVCVESLTSLTCTKSHVDVDIFRAATIPALYEVIKAVGKIFCQIHF